jgi:hypothetical protein
MENEILTHWGFRLELDDFNQKRLASQKALLFISNHLYPGLDELLFQALLSDKDQPVLAVQPGARLFPAIMQPFMIAPDKTKPRLTHKHFMQRVETLLDSGTCIAMPFSKWGFMHLGNPKYTKEAMELILKLKQDVVPIHFVPDKPIAFQKLTQKAKLLLNKPTEPIVIRACIGTPIGYEDLKIFSKKMEARQYVQARIFSLGTKLIVKKDWFLKKEPVVTQTELAAAVDPELIEQELDQIRATHLYYSKSDYEAFVVPSALIPYALQEIGRLRELTFRSIGEGTGSDRDLDQYDLYYEQLFIWDKKARRIVGGYRLGNGEKIMFKFGFHGFYSNSLFKFKRPFERILVHALELGRSFIVPDYQRKPLPLFIQWQCILTYIKRDPNVKYLIGPVSITNDYAVLSKKLMVDFLKRYYLDTEHHTLIEPRKPFLVEAVKINIELLSVVTKGNLQRLGALIEGIEPKHLGIPVLLRQYIKQNARFLAFNRDPNFSDCIDGFMLLDVEHLPTDTIDLLNRSDKKELISQN